MKHREIANWSRWLIGAAWLALPLASGCFSTVPTGKGKIYHRVCEAVGRDYYLYVPVNYNAERRYPLVVTLHGMKPYDNPHNHPEMWGGLADQHRFVVVAPVLQTSDSLGRFPPTGSLIPAERNDVRCVLAIMDEVINSWEVDRNAVLLSSWSMGGFLAHYIASEYGDRFAAFAPLQSNFSNDILNPANARRFAKTLPIFIFYGSSDIAVVTNQARESIEWWRSLGFRVETRDAPVWHQRHPELAAEFFDNVLARNQRKVSIVVTPPTPNPAPLVVNLWPAISSKVADVKSYRWDFGQQLGTSPLKSPNVLIRHPGDYPIRLTVVDSANRQHVAEATLRVLPTASAQRNWTPGQQN